MKSPYQVIDVDLKAGIPELSLKPGYQGMFVVLWMDAIPLGTLEIAASQWPLPQSELVNQIVRAIAPAVGDHLMAQGFADALPVAAASQPQPPDFKALMALNAPLKQLQDMAQTGQVKNLGVSVIICTRDRPEQLERCLHSLQHLKDPPQQILVVDNAPTSPATRQVVAKFETVDYVLEPKPGLSVARNTGLAHSTGELIVFTDDDVVVHPHWLEGIQRGFDDPTVMAVTGLMLPAELESEAQVIFHRGTGESSWGFRALTFDTQFFTEMMSRGAPVWRIGAGANMAFRRSLFDRVGNFDERLGAGASGCSEDSELWYRVLAEGYACRYEPTAVIYHYHRKDLPNLKHQAFQYMRGHVVALLVQFERYSHWGNLRRLFFELPLYYTRLMLFGMLRGFRGHYHTVPAQVSGCIAGIVYYWQHRLKKPTSTLPVPTLSQINQGANS